MLNGQYGDPNIAKLLQLVVNIVQVYGKLFWCDAKESVQIIVVARIC